MRVRRRAVALALLAPALAACERSPTGPEAQGLPQGYTVVALPATLAPLSPVALNNRGQVALASHGGSSFVVWGEEGVTTYSAWSGQVTALDDTGRIVGYTGWLLLGTPPPEQRPFVGEAGRLWYLTGPGLERARALGINAAGTVVGVAQRPEGMRAFIRSGAGVTLIAPLPGDTASEAVAVSERGRVLVRSMATQTRRMFVSTRSRSALLRDGQLVELGVLADWQPAAPGQVADVQEFSHVARDLNDRDEVVGSAHGMVCSPDGNVCFTRSRAFLWRDGRMHDLGRAHDQNNSLALAINASGHVLLSISHPGRTQYLLWHDGRLLDLDEAIAATGWRLSHLVGLNDAGQMVGTARNDATGAWGAVRLDPVR